MYIGILLLIYLGGLLLIWMLFSSSIIDLFHNKGRNPKKRFRSIENEKISKSTIYKHIYTLLAITAKDRKHKDMTKAVFTFFFVSISIFVVMLILLSRQSSIMFNLITSMLFALLPYGWLWAKLISLRVEASYEGENLVSELLNQYKINYFNMSEAIDKSIGFLDNSPHVQYLLSKLSYQLKESATDDDLMDAINQFTFGIDTEWSKMLSNNIHLAVDDGLNVSVGLDDILKELRQAKSTFEINNRINSEGFTIVQLLSPLMYGGSIYIAVKYFDFTILKFMSFQLFTATGLKFTMVMVGLFLINIGIIVAFKNRKFDF